MNPEVKSAVDTKLLELIEQHLGQPGALLPLLHAVQDALGHVAPEVVPVIAEALNLSRAEVHGVVTYYHFFRSTPPGRHVIQVCRAEACQACGAEELLAHAERTLGCSRHETRADGAVTLEPVYCLGLCASSPAIQIDERVHARMTPERLDRLVADLEVNP
ncbi:MAG: formate dehydrogenase subunit gamma [Burkholderiales bacterium]|nr:formate dehydrogenase subunit gamma [Burkholderiales bacterium]